MEKYVLILTAAVVILLSSCSNPAAYYEVWSGNNSFVGGDYQEANTKYLNASKSGVYSDYISYNLANVYYALGEGGAASEEWKKAAFSGNRNLLFRTMYNRGVYEFESGNYNSAFELFRKSLEINPDSLNAKINLEYSLRRMTASNNAQQGSASGADIKETDEVSDEIMRVLEFIKQKDATVWEVNRNENVVTGEKDW